MKVMLLDFVNRVTRWISHDEARQMMDEQEQRGVVLTGDTYEPPGPANSQSVPE